MQRQGPSEDRQAATKVKAGNSPGSVSYLKYIAHVRHESVAFANILSIAMEEDKCISRRRVSNEQRWEALFRRDRKL